MVAYVFDASAVLAIIQNEPGSERALSLLESGDCCISAVNLSEVGAKLFLRGMSVEEVGAACSGLPLEVVPVDEACAMLAAQLAPVGKPLGLSLGDRICLATTMIRNAVAVTAEKVWASLHDPKVEVIR